MVTYFSLTRPRSIAIAAFVASVLVLAISFLAPGASQARSADTASSQANATTSQRTAGAKLKLRAEDLPKAIPVNKARRFKVRMTNVGKVPVRKIQVSLRGTKGLALKPGKRSFSRLLPGRTVSINVSVRAGRRAAARGRIVVTAKAPRAGTARLARALRVTRPRSGPKTQPGTGATTSPAGHYFWTLEDVRVDQSSDPIGFYFADDRFVHVGLPEGGLPVCDRANAKRDIEGKIESGCVRYSFNPRNGAVVIGGELRGKFTAKKGASTVEFDGTTYDLATIPTRGSKLRATLINRGFFGFCGFVTGCTTWKENLVLDRQGRFVRSRSSISSMGGAGTPFVWGANFPPDEYGTYRILGNGRIQFRYQDGSVSNETIAILHNDQGRPDTAGEGLILDQTWFYLEVEY